ncbi:hypothetical protein CJ030_MR3G001168 [Morella rubra]|uniref:C2 domain-containing protein n=1 Tax=Morella rubra TaxID=262757 RepID=A0A6A1W279_9ROSI|nr:hypothetical protein CJ030_MR3G001168 [Morella rubra]
MSNILAPFQLLELNVISAQDLANISRSMRTYAVAWVHPDRKLSTRVDTHGDSNPTWNDKFVFRVDEEFLHSDTSAIMVEIYALHWFRDIHVGTVRVLVGNLIPTPSRSYHQHNTYPQVGMRFVALQVRRPSGRPQGILNIGVAVLDSSMRSMPLYSQLNDSAGVGYRHLMGEEDSFQQPGNGSNQTPLSKPSLRRAKSDTSSMIASELRASEFRKVPQKKNGKPSSTVNGSEVGHKKKKVWSRGSSLISGSEVERGRGKKNNKKTSSVLSYSEVGVDPRHRGKIEKSESVISGSDVGAHLPPQKGRKKGSRKGKPSSILSVSDVAPVDLPSKKVVLNDKPIIEFEDWSDSELEKPKVRLSTLERAGFKVDFGAPRKAITPMHALATPMHAHATPKHPRATPVHHRATPMHAKSFHKFNGLMEYGTPRRSAFMQYGTTPGRRSTLRHPAPILTESELGPSPSEVAAEMVKVHRLDEEASSVGGGGSVDESVEGLQSKLERWQTALPPVLDRGELSSLKSSEKRHARRHTDGGNGLFSCFSNICGCQCHIVCGGESPEAERKKGGGGKARRSVSVGDLGFI